MNTFVGDWRLSPEGYLLMANLDSSLAPVCLSIDDSSNVYETVCQGRGAGCSCTTFAMISHPVGGPGEHPATAGDANLAAAPGTNGSSSNAQSEAVSSMQRLLAPILSAVLGLVLLLALLIMYVLRRPSQLPMWLRSKLAGLRPLRTDAHQASRPDPPSSSSRGNAAQPTAAMQSRDVLVTLPAASPGQAVPSTKADVSIQGQQSHLVLDAPQLQALASISPALWEQYTMGQLPAVDWVQLLHQHRLLQQQAFNRSDSNSSTPSTALGRAKTSALAAAAAAAPATTAAGTAQQSRAACPSKSTTRCRASSWARRRTRGPPLAWPACRYPSTPGSSRSQTSSS
jgi:hypothetical protein